MKLEQIIELNKIDQEINKACECNREKHSIYVYKSCIEYYQNNNNKKGNK